MAGKQSKKERKAQREAERERLRKAERQRTLMTVIVVVIIVAIGGVLVYVSLEDPGPDLAELEEQLAELRDATEDPADATEPDEDPEADPTADADEASEQPTDPADAGERPVACGAELPASADSAKPTFDAPEQVVEEGVDYRAVIETSCGRVVIDLGADRAPETVNSFVFLATEGFFDGLEIFRNATGISALQTGSGTNEATWQIGYSLPDELTWAEEEGYPPGAVAMANSGPDTSGSQFFFVYGDGFANAVRAGGLAPTFTRFGTVVEGLDVLQRVGEIPTGGERGETPQERVFMESVEIVTGDGG